MKKTLYVIDASSYYYRAYYAIRSLTNSKGFPTNAIYGFTNMLIKILNDFNPTHVVCVFDSKEPTFRNDLYKEYKANREEMPDDLKPQVPYIKNVIKSLNISVLEKPGFEADDIIGAVCEKAKDIEVFIISGDKDLMQLVSDKIKMIDTMKDRIISTKEVKEKFGVTPDKVIDVLGLAGDSSDNVPGLPGVGEKTATKLITEFGSIENIYKNIDKVSKTKLKENLIKFKDLLFLSKKLVTIDKNVGIQFNIDEFKVKEFDEDKIYELFKELEFYKLMSQLTKKKETIKKEYKTVSQAKELDEIINNIEKAKILSVDLETTSENPMEAELVGVSITFNNSGQSYYVPVGHLYLGCPDQIKKEIVLEKIKNVLENKNIKKIGQNFKYDYIVFKNNGINVCGISFDTMIGSYLLNPSKYKHSLDNIAQEYLNYKTISYDDVTKKGRSRINFREVDIKTATDYACEDSHITFLIAEKLEPEINNNNLDKLFWDIELPLSFVLASVEMSGVKVDVEKLNKLSVEFNDKIKKLEKDIFNKAGTAFNINSPKQLGEVLFVKLGFKGAKKTKTGYSTDVSVLEELSKKHKICEQILEYRKLSKLKSTYVDALPELVNKKTQRIHTSFNQTITATGRLSSSNPNLQNIPIRTDDGKKIREAFIAEKENVLISADYSQIELRILAHISGDKSLKEAFLKDEDVHTKTAMDVFDLSKEEVTEDYRRIAKTINFGIIYGISSFGLSKQLDITPGEASGYIDSYFVKYPGVKKYMDETINQAKKDGYVKTLLNRIRYLPEINSKNFNIKSFAERTAINTPIQGTAADFIKIAMLKIDKVLAEKKLKTKMILQVHDELVFESPESEKEEVINLVKKEMENVYELGIPLKVDIGVGKNWKEAH